MAEGLGQGGQNGQLTGGRVLGVAPQGDGPLSGVLPMLQPPALVKGCTVLETPSTSVHTSWVLHGVVINAGAADDRPERVALMGGLRTVEKKKE